jgi:plastocyanin
MKRISTICATLLLIASSFIVSPLFATTHTITFGGAAGFTYQPSTLSVTVGDTIEWIGDFGFHPLASTQIPAGASAFTNGSGSSFSYVVPAVGTYNYVCTVHGGSGMTGSFTAIAAGVRSASTASVTLEQSSPNPAIGSTSIRFTLEHAQPVEIELYSIDGIKVATVLNEPRAAGEQSVTVSTDRLASGSYIYLLRTPDAVLTRNMIVVR